MSLKTVHRFLTAPREKISKDVGIFWWILALTFADIFGIMVLQIAFGSEYVVQDDARQHVFWMERFIDPQLFPNDWIADYFQAVAPAGYTGLYWVMAKVGISPMLLHKLLPPVLGLITTGYCFAIAMQLLPVPIAGFLSASLLNHYIWMRDDVVSATAVAFVYPLFTAFLYYLLKRQLIGTCLAIALLGLFYPQCVLIAAGILILQLLQVSHGRLHLSRDRQNYIFSGITLTVAMVVMVLYALKSNDYGPVITAAEARTLPEFLSGGNGEFFNDNFGDFWFSGQRSGMMPRFGTILPIILGCFLPVILLLDKWIRTNKNLDINLRNSENRDENQSIFSLLKGLKNARILLDVTLASLGMFFISHALIFRLHLPSRYTEHSLRIVTAIAAGIAVTVILDAILNWGERSESSAKLKRILAGTVALLIVVAIVFEPTWLKRFPRTDYIVGEVPPVYEFFASQPKDILIASVSEEVNNIPSFSQRSILIGGEGYPVPYHKGYYGEIRQRTIDLIKAHYSPNLQDVQSFIEKYGIDFWLVEEGAFTPEYLTRDDWMMQYQPTTNEAIATLQEGKTPALAILRDRCTVFKSDRFFILQASCTIAPQIETP